MVPTFPVPPLRSPVGLPRTQRCGASPRNGPNHARHVAVEFVHPVIVGNARSQLSPSLLRTRLTNCEQSHVPATSCVS